MLKRLFILLVLLLLPLAKAWASIQRIKMEQQNGSTMLKLLLDRPIPLKNTKESDGLFVIEGFEQKDWKPDKKGSGQGGIKKYYVEEYSNGEAELVVQTEPGMIISNFQMVPRGSYYVYEVMFSKGAAPLLPSSSDSTPFMVKRVQVGQKDAATRLVIYLNRSANFNISPNNTGTELLLVPDSFMEWDAQTTLDHATGVFQGYELVQQFNRPALKIKTIPGTKVGNASIQGADNADPKYVIDLVPDTISAVGGDQLFDATGQGQINRNDAAMKVAGDTGLIRSMDILTESDDTIIKLVTTEPLNLDVTENEYTHQVIVHLPKTNWMNVNVLDKNGGLVNSYKIDQSSADGTNLVLNVSDGTHVIGKKTMAGGKNQANRFVIYLNKNEKKLPTWLVDATTQHMEYEDEHRGEAELERVAYRGGVTPHASIGQGPYAGWNLTFFGSEDKQEQNNTTGMASSKIPVGSTGIEGELYVGLGTGFLDKFYLGGELMAGYYFNKQTRTFRGTGEGYSSNSMNMGMTWGGSVRIGGYVAPMALAYARFGVVSTDFWFNGSPSANGTVTYPTTYSRRNRSGFLYGAGLDTAYDDYTSLRFEVNQTTYQAFDHNAKNTANVLNNIKHRFILNQVSIGMTHHFRPMSGPAVSPVYEESVVRGLYGGVIFALNNTYAKRNVTNTITATKTEYYEGTANSDPLWGFYTGYGRARGRFYYAGEIDVALSQSVTKETVNWGGTTESFVDTLKWRWGAVGRFGYILNHGVMGYMKLGFASTKFTRSNNNTGVAVGSGQIAPVKEYKKFLLGIRSGLGLEVTVNNAFGVRSDWTVDYYPKVNISDPALGREKQSIIDNRFGIGLTVYLNEALASMGLGTHL